MAKSKNIDNFLYFGNVKKCVKLDFSHPNFHELVIGVVKPKVESENIRNDVLLAKIDSGHYVEYSSLNKLFISVMVKFGLFSGKIILGTSPYEKGDLFVDKQSIVPCDEVDIPDEKVNKIMRLQKNNAL